MKTRTLTFPRWELFKMWYETTKKRFESLKVKRVKTNHAKHCITVEIEY